MDAWRIGRSFAIGAAALLAVACGKGPAPEEKGEGPSRESLKPVPLEVATVETAPAPIRVQASGSFEPEDEVTVAAEVAGRIVEIGPEVGDRIGEDALLARIDPIDYVLVRDQRARFLAEVLTKLGLERLPEGDVDFEKLPSVEKARLEAANAKARYDRSVRLEERTPGSISVQDLADQKLGWDVAESALREVRLAARTDLAQARTRAADLAVAEQNVKDTTLRAPKGVSTWVIAERRVAVGDYVSVGATAYRLLDTDPLRLVLRIPERRMTGVAKGRPVVVETATRKEPVTGTVLRVRPEVDLKTRTYEVEVEVANPAGALSVGAFAIASIETGEDPAVPVVPSRAVVTFAGVTKVFVPKEGKVAERLVVLGRTLGDRVEVLQGLKPGDRFVADPAPDLVNGTPIAAPAGAGPERAPAAPPPTAPASSPPARPAK